MTFLPINRQEMLARGWDSCDFVYVSGDAYVDHPSFGVAIISRVLESHGYKVAILPQPDCKNDEEFLQFGKPRLGFLVSSGNIDSMVNHYSVNKRRRDNDSYSDEGVMGKRPDRATIVYSKKIRSLFADSAIIVGGIEASLRRLAHYDYWDDKVRPSLLLDSQADMLLYGMGENSIVELADALDSGLSIKDITYIRGSVYARDNTEGLFDYIVLPSFSEIKNNKQSYAKSFLIQSENHDAMNATMLVEPYNNCVVVVNTPPLPLSRDEMDYVYRLNYMRNFHPTYKYIPAIEEVKFSIISNRGCYGSCSFCALAAHQGRIIQSRSKDSIVEEVKQIVQDPTFKGYIHDVGGPTANFYHPSCDKQIEHGTCKTKQCLHPKPCNQLKVSHQDYLDILRACRVIPGVKKVFVRSGVRYDYAMLDDGEFLEELVEHHISGQLKVAPEHISNRVLDYMRKGRFEVYDAFVKKYTQLNIDKNKKQYLVPYWMSSHPGCTLEDAIELACYLKKMNQVPQQVQDFYPTPSTLSTCMYFTELDPRTMKPVYVAKSHHDKLLQRALMQYSFDKNRSLVIEALTKANRLDLIGNKKTCLISSSQRGEKKYDYRKQPKYSRSK